MQVGSTCNHTYHYKREAEGVLRNRYIHRGEDEMNTEWTDAATSQGMPTGSYQKLEEARKVSQLEPLEGAWPSSMPSFQTYLTSRIQL